MLKLPPPPPVHPATHTTHRFLATASQFVQFIPSWAVAEPAVQSAPSSPALQVGRLPPLIAPHADHPAPNAPCHHTVPSAQSAQSDQALPLADILPVHSKVSVPFTNILKPAVVNTTPVSIVRLS